MPRVLSPAAAAASLAAQSPEVWLACLVISGPGLETMRIVNNTEAITRAAGEFAAYPFEAELPEDGERAGGTATLRLDNIDREVTRLLRDYTGIATATIEVVLASQPDTVEIGPLEFAVLGAEYDELVIQLSLGHEEDLLNQRVPAQAYQPSNSQGLWP
ncbi:MAG: DUF1833 family protein [Pseudoxanthomonas sp.]|nr:DUF1833 family protein [Pseudoxanthomonas sp.]